MDAPTYSDPPAPPGIFERPLPRFESIFNPEDEQHQNEQSKGWKHRGVVPRKVRNVDTGEVYESVQDCQRKTGIDYKAIYYCCTERAKKSKPDATCGLRMGKRLRLEWVK